MSIIDYINAYTDEGVNTSDDLLDKIREEIIEKYWGCDICKWRTEYRPHYNVRGDIDEILQIIDKYKAESEEV